METINMELTDEIRIQNVVFANTDYRITWFASARHSEFLVCLKSSWMSYNVFADILRSRIIGGKNGVIEYQDRELFCRNVTGLTELKLPTSTMIPPIDVIVLPLKNNSIYIPKDEEGFKKLQKSIKGIINYTQKSEAIMKCLFPVAAKETFTLKKNESLPVSQDEIIAEYIVDGKRYPITAGMFDKEISVQIPRNLQCRLSLTNGFDSKYILRRIEG